MSSRREQELEAELKDIQQQLANERELNGMLKRINWALSAQLRCVEIGPRIPAGNMVTDHRDEWEKGPCKKY